MSNTINHSNYLSAYQNINSADNKFLKSAFTNSKLFENAFPGKDSVEFSKKGLEALKEYNKQPNVNNASCNQTVKSREDKLSSKAQKYLDNLRSQFGDYDFIVADAGDDFRGLVDQSDKEYSIVFSSAELERMASDEKYAAEKLHQIDTAVKMSDRINEQFGFERAWSKDAKEELSLSKMAITFDDDGNMKIFAELEKTSAKQAERIKEAKEKRTEEKENSSKKLDEKKNKDIPAKIQIEATSADELWDKIRNLNLDEFAK